MPRIQPSGEQHLVGQQQPQVATTSPPRTTPDWFYYTVTSGFPYVAAYVPDAGWDGDYVACSYTVYMQVNPWITTPPAPAATSAVARRQVGESAAAHVPSSELSRLRTGSRAMRAPRLADSVTGGVLSEWPGVVVTDPYPPGVRPPDPRNSDVVDIRLGVRSLDDAWPEQYAEPPTGSKVPFLWFAWLTVPGPGPVEIWAEVEFNNGAVEKVSVARTINDWLILGMGDSFASGQGVPDAPVRWQSTSFGGQDDNYCSFENALVRVVKGAVESYASTSFEFDTNLGNVARAPQWQEPRAWRAAYNPQYKAVLHAESLVPHTARFLSTFVTTASSGARTVDMIQRQRPHQKGGQIREARDALRLKGTRIRRLPDIILLSITGNDVGFVDLLTSMATGNPMVTVTYRPSGIVPLAASRGSGALYDDLTGDEWGLPSSFSDLPTVVDREQEMNAAFTKALDLAMDRLDDVAKRIADDLEPRRILLTEYPVGLFNREDGQPAAGCGAFSKLGINGLGISQREAEWIRARGLELNARLKAFCETRESQGWRFVEGIYEAFRRHGYCSPEPYFVGVSESCQTQGDFMGAMHPNAAGQMAIARVLGEAIRNAQNELGSPRRKFLPQLVDPTTFSLMPKFHRVEMPGSATSGATENRWVLRRP